MEMSVPDTLKILILLYKKETCYVKCCLGILNTVAEINFVLIVTSNDLAYQYIVVWNLFGLLLQFSDTFSQNKYI